MRTRDFNALNDLLFKFIFGHKENKNIPLSFINAVLGLEGERAFVDLRFADREIDPEEETGKGSTLDLLCMTNDETQINIEVQVQNRQNMGQRSLYYWAKLYQSTLGRGENYENLRRTVAINLLGYEYLPLSGFHHMYGLYDETGKHRLTEDIEIHFLELPKVTRQDIRSMRTLDKWMAFIGNKLSDEEMEAIAMSEAAIDTAWDRIEAFMRDAGQRRKYEQREKFEHDYVSDMEGSWKRGVSQGRQLGIAHMAMNMLRVGTPV
ncbi:hypothetical protein AXF19_07825, partial [Selenomonas sp. oral taxon 126]|uniref:Rpn family recombination-promoting nuclease/putative transposase n=1 Tax=Selenomonas sp. oral taxon 126 TaxID=712528 RepID=UPI0008078F2C